MPARFGGLFASTANAWSNLNPSHVAFTIGPRGPGFSGMSYALRQIFLIQFKPHGVGLDIGKLGQPFVQPEYEEDGRINPQRHAWLALLDLIEGRSADRCPLGHDFRGNAPPQTAITDVPA